MKNHLLQSSALTAPAPDEPRNRGSFARYGLRIGSAAAFALMLTAAPLTIDSGSVTQLQAAAEGRGADIWTQDGGNNNGGNNNRNNDWWNNGGNNNNRNNNWWNNGGNPGECGEHNDQGECGNAGSWGNDDGGNESGEHNDSDNDEGGENNGEGGEDGWPFN